MIGQGRGGGAVIVIVIINVSYYRLSLNTSLQYAPHPPPLKAPGGSQSPFAVSQALADDEAVLHHNGEARVRPHHDVLLLDLGPLLLSTAVPVHVASKTELNSKWEDEMRSKTHVRQT